jgi:hypothetical protein
MSSIGWDSRKPLVGAPFVVSYARPAASLGLGRSCARLPPSLFHVSPRVPWRLDRLTMLLDEQIVAIERAFGEAELPHAFGGAQALAYYGPIRATHDIDLNVFVPAHQGKRVLDTLGTLGAEVSNPGLLVLIERDEQVRVFWDGTPIDLFFAYDDLHHSSMKRRRPVDFYGDSIHILSAEDLLTYKAIFDRPKDWNDIAGMIFACAEPMDFDYVRHWLERIDDDERRRLDRLERLIESDGVERG